MGNWKYILVCSIKAIIYPLSLFQSNKWSGLKIDDPFHYSEAIVLIVINGIDNLDIKGVSYPIITNEDEETTWTNLKKSINERFLEQNNTLLRLTISDLISKVWV